MSLSPAVVSSVQNVLPSRLVFVIGVALLVATAVRCTFADYLDKSRLRQFTMSERAREEWELDNNPQGEKDEMIEIYIEKGFSPSDAHSAIEILSSNKAFFVDLMLVQELGLMPPNANDTPRMLLTQSLLFFTAYVSAGSLPLVPYVGVREGSVGDTSPLLAATLGTFFFLFLLHFMQAKWYGHVYEKGYRPQLATASWATLHCALSAGAAFMLCWGLCRAFQLSLCLSTGST